jgi:hypothetical protein
MRAVIKRAGELYNSMDWLEVSDGSKRVIITPREGQEYQDCLDITFKVSEATSLDSDSVYEFTREALGIIYEADDNASEDKIRDQAYEQIEPDTYTSELTDFIGRGNSNVYYLTEALNSYNYLDGFEVLRESQLIAKQEVFDLVFEWLISNHKEQ